MKGIDEEYVPKFKFFQIKKSYLKNKAGVGGQQKEMVCFIDVS